MYSWRWESALIRLLCHYRWDYGQEYRLCIESVRALWNRFPLLPVTDDSLLKYKSICQHPNHVVILIKTTGVLSSLLKHCLRVFFRRDTGIVFLARLKPAEPMRLAQPELMIMWGCKDSLFNFEFDNLLFLHMWAVMRRCLPERKAGKNACGFCFRYPRLPKGCALGSCCRQKSWSSLLE